MYAKNKQDKPRMDVPLACAMHAAYMHVSSGATAIAAADAIWIHISGYSWCHMHMHMYIYICIHIYIYMDI